MFRKRKLSKKWRKLNCSLLVNLWTMDIAKRERAKMTRELNRDIISTKEADIEDLVKCC